jgi:hypothetical protein
MMLRSIAVGSALLALSINCAFAAQTTSISNHKPPPGVAAPAGTGGTSTPMEVQGRVQLDSDWNSKTTGCTKVQGARGVWKAPAGGMDAKSCDNAQGNQPAGMKGDMTRGTFQPH